MFVVVTTQEQPRGLLTRAKDRITGGNLISQRKTFLGNVYYHMTVQGGSVPWDRIAGMVGRAATRLVLPPQLEPPPGRGLGRYNATIFEGRLTALAAAQALRQSPHPGGGTTLGMLDEDGLWGWCCRELAPLCGAVRVYTQRPQRYEAISRQMMEDWGASVVLADQPQELERCDFAISPASTGVVRLRLPVITVTHSGVQGRPTINRLRLQLPQDLLDQIPPDIQPEDFLGAAYELGTRRIPLTFSLGECRVDGRRAALEEIHRTWS